jgi:hypothetical protein
MNKARWLLLINLAVSFYSVGAIWLMQGLIYPLWSDVSSKDFPSFQADHLQHLFYVVFPQAGLAALIAVVMLWWRPPHVPVWALWLAVALQAAWIIGTVIWWGQWQAQLATPVGPLPAMGPPNAALFQQLLATHWIRVAIISAAGVLAFWMTVVSFRPVNDESAVAVGQARPAAKPIPAETTPAGS